MAEFERNGFKQDDSTLKSLGAKLRSLREAQSLSFEDVAEETHVRPFVLQAIEEGRIEEIPSLVYARGFVKTYCDFLCAMDLWQKFDPLLKSDVDLREAMVGHSEDMGDISSPRPVFRRSSMVWVYAILLFAVSAAGLLVWQQQRGGAAFFPSFRTPAMPDRDAVAVNSPDMGAASLDLTLLTSPDHIVSAEALAALSGDALSAELPAETARESARAPATIFIEGRGKSGCWVGIYSGSKLVYRTTVRSGDVKSYDVAEEVHVRFGNAGAVRVEWGGRVYDPIGKLGTPASFYFTPEGDMGPGKRKPSQASQTGEPAPASSTSDSL